MTIRFEVNQKKTIVQKLKEIARKRNESERKHQ